MASQGHVLYRENSRVRGHIGPLYCESLFFFWLQLEVAIELLSGINMLLISMVALKMLIPQLFYGGSCAVVTQILQWPYGHRCSCRNVAVAIQGHHIANQYLFPAADKAIEFLLISMVASKMLMPQKKIKSPKKGNGYRFIRLTVRIILRWILHSCHRILQRTYGHRGYCKHSWVAIGNPYFFMQQRWPQND